VWRDLEGVAALDVVAHLPAGSYRFGPEVEPSEQGLAVSSRKFLAQLPSSI
jgi:hypothetical protein